MKTQYKYLTFKQIPVKLKTQVWECFSKDDIKFGEEFAGMALGANIALL